MAYNDPPQTALMLASNRRSSLKGKRGLRDNVNIYVFVLRWAAAWMIRGSSPGKGWEFFASSPPPDRL